MKIKSLTPIDSNLIVQSFNHRNLTVIDNYEKLEETEVAKKKLSNLTEEQTTEKEEKIAEAPKNGGSLNHI